MDLTVQQKKKHLLLLNRLYRMALKEELIPTPSKLSEDKIEALFTKLFMKKDNFFVPKVKNQILKIDEDEFKKLIPKTKQPKEKVKKEVKLEPKKEEPKKEEEPDISNYIGITYPSFLDNYTVKIYNPLNKKIYIEKGKYTQKELIEELKKIIKKDNPEKLYATEPSNGQIILKYVKKEEPKKEEPKKEEPKKEEPKKENFDVLSSELQKLILLTKIEDIIKVLVKLGYKGRIQTNKILMTSQILQNFNTIDKIKNLIKALEENKK